MIRFLVLAVTVFLIGCSSLQPQPRLASALVFHAPFDQSADAVLGAGDRRIQTGPSWGAPRSSPPGLPTEGTVSVKPNEGRYGGALYFSKKIPQMVGFRVPGNMPFRTNNWSGSISFWLKVSPDEDLEPGYCDVIQVTSKGWDDASLFVEFTKDEKPREMRLGVYADKAVWNPGNRDWGTMPLGEKPLARVERPPFRRDRWTHVAFTWDHFNTGHRDGVCRLYLDGVPTGGISAREQTFHWDLSQAVMMLGLAYTGWMDDLSVFDRALTPNEIKMLHALVGGASELRK